MTEEEKKDITHTIACLIFEGYDKKTILTMYPSFINIYDTVYADALAGAMALVHKKDWQ